MDIRGLVWVLTGRSTKQTKEEVVEKWVWISGRQASLHWPFLRSQIIQKKLTKTFFADFLKSFGIFFFKASSAVDPPIKIEARSFEFYLHLFYFHHNLCLKIERKVTKWFKKWLKILI